MKQFTYAPASETANSLRLKASDLVRKNFGKRIGFLNSNLGRLAILNPKALQRDLQIEKAILCVY
jgi:hypothetical protein